MYYGGNMLKITVITVCCNAKNRVGETIKSVCNQTYHDIEYLIVDGASTDGTEEILSEYSKYPDIKIYSEKDFGIYNAMNRGIARASGDFIIFINAGDSFYKNDVVEKAVTFMEKNRDAIYYGNVAVKIMANERILDEEEDIKKGLSTGWMPCHQAVFAPTYSLRNHYFNEHYQIRADYEWLVYCVCNNIECIRLPFVVCNYDKSGVSSDALHMETRHAETQEVLNRYLLELLEGQSITEYQEKRIRDLMEIAGKNETLFRFMDQWMFMMQRGMNISDFLLKHNYYRIAVYGMGAIGQRFVESLRNTSIMVEYAIDRKADKIKSVVPIVTPDGILEPVDVVVITAITYIKEIEDTLKSHINCSMISIKEILDTMMLDII